MIYEFFFSKIIFKGEHVSQIICKVNSTYLYCKYNTKQKSLCVYLFIYENS